MQKEQTYISADIDLSSHLPLESIILYLKSNGFSIKPDDYIEILKVIERFKPATLEEAGVLICPLIVTNDEDQARFYLVFKKLCESGILPEQISPPSFWKKTILKVKKIFATKRAKYLLIIIPVLLIALWFLFKQSNPVHTNTELTGAAITFANSSKDEDEVVWQVGDSILLHATWQIQREGTTLYYYKDPSSEDSNNITLEWDLGNGWESRNKRDVTLVASKPGPIQARLRMFLRNKLLSNNSINIPICEKFPNVTITSFPDSNLASDFTQPVSLNSNIQLRANISPDTFKGLSSIWIVNGDTVSRNSKILQPNLDKEGLYNIRFVVMPWPGSPDCYKSYFLSFTVKDPNAEKFHLQTEQLGAAIKPPKKIKNWLQDLIFFLFLIPFIATIILRSIMRIRKRAVKKLINSVFEPANTASGDKKPVFEIPLENRQQQLIASEPAMNDAMRFMLQRTMDESLALNINQTVQNTIRSGGIPDLVYSNKLRNNDYLILIDSTVSNSQQLKLFEYLVRTFKTENISIVRFFYQDNFSKFYNEEYPSGFSVKRLAELYKDFTLIIFGTAHHLVYDAYPVIEAERLNELADWENRGILTPLPFKDWGIKEKLIGQQIILLPADAEGQLRLMKAINEKLLNHRDYLSSQKDFYSTRNYDFTEPADIKTYLRDEDLYQCICAIAIYPKIRWEVLIELGKAVLQSRGCPEKMNYSNLLKLVRISWLQEGYFPEYTRLELLKQLGVQEEIVARKKLVELFQYADLYYKDNYFFSNEKKVQEITNKFIIYANDPVTHEDYIASKEQFEALWKQNKITDAPLKEYIDDPGKGSWKTPIKDPKVTTVGKDNPVPKLAKWSKVLSEISGVCLLLLLGISQFGNNFAKTGAARFLGISAADSSRLVPVTVDISPFGKCMDNENDSTLLTGVAFSVYDDPNKPYESYDSTTIEEKPNDSNNPVNYGTLGKSFKIPYRSLVSGNLKLDISWVETNSAKAINPGLTIKMRTLNILQQQYNNESRVNPLSPKAKDLKKQMSILRSQIDSLRVLQIDDTLTNPPVNHSQTTNVAFTTDKINTTISACKKPVDLVPVPVANAGPDISITLPVNTITLKGKGIDPEGMDIVFEWIKLSGPAGGTLTNPNKATTTVSGLVEGVYSYMLMVTNEREVSGMDTVNVNVNATIGTCNSIPISQLPLSLTEIWKGQRINRLITIDLAKKKIWYSTSDKKSFGTYTIEQVCQSGNSYKIITSGNNQFRNFFIRDIGAQRFDLSVCADFVATLQQAIATPESSCNSYDNMQLYYEKNPPADLVSLFKPRTVIAFYLPYTRPQLNNTQSSRLNSFLQKAKAKGEKSIDLNGNLNSALVPDRNSEAYFNEMKTNFTRALNAFGLQLGKPDFDGSDGTPFDRNYFWVFDIDTVRTPSRPDTLRSFPMIFGAAELKHDCGSLVKDVWVVNSTNTCNDRNKYSTHGPFVKLPAGNYIVEWELGADSLSPLNNGRILQIDIADASNAVKVLGLRNLTQYDLASRNAQFSFRTYTISFTVDKSIADHMFEFRVQQMGKATIRLRKISLIQKDPAGPQ
ncbi:MAG TPA: hypothetical protein VK483_01795 [Chitinophagaceae bacterium]|nr:hypothetical protein [Chitinophagaceae bacterium]